MNEQKRQEALCLMIERFGHDTLISAATIDGNRPAVRTVNSYYENGSFYTVTYALSNKMKQIEVNPQVAICGEWFTEWVKILVGCVMIRTRKLCQNSARPLRNGMITAIQMKMIRILVFYVLD